MEEGKKENSFLSNWLFREQGREGFPGNICEPDYDDSSWAVVNVPHDWSVEHPFEEKWDGCTGYLPGGIGWYRKHFSLPDDAAKDAVYLCFDGVYNNADFYLNGKRLGTHNYGYSPFQYEISRFLEKGDNVLAVKVDRTRYADSRWYTGSGIFREVELQMMEAVHILPHGTFITTPEINERQGKVRLITEIAGLGPRGGLGKREDGEESINRERYSLETEILSPQGKRAAFEESQVGGFTTIQMLEVETPLLWDTETPQLYRAITRLKKEGMVIQSYETPFGFRTILFDRDRGFFLNGVNTPVKGVCLHHDAGLVGAAVPDALWVRRLLKLKEGGCNAIRTAHNPPSRNFLDLCDRLGMLVQNEFYDEWDNPKDKQKNGGQQSSQYITQSDLEPFKSWAERELKNTMRRDRNHPCIIQWSIGNEIEWCYPECRDVTGYWDADVSGNYFWTRPPVGREEIARRVKALPPRPFDIGVTAEILARWVREMDITRPVIANCILPSASYENGYADALDMAGFSYRRVLYDYVRENYPDKPFMGTENVGQWHEWKAVEERDFVSGIFLWTGIDYMGESHGQWPVKATGSGLLDTAGFDKPSWHMFKTLWTGDPHSRIFTVPLVKSLYQDDGNGGLIEKNPGSWEKRLWLWHDVNRHWNYGEGDPTVVEVYSNRPEMELFLNKTSLGKQNLADWEDRIYKWFVPFEGGILELRDGDGCVADVLTTAGKPVEPEITLETFPGDDSHVHVTVQLIDGKRRPVCHEEREIRFFLDGKGEILGVDNGANNSVQAFRSDSLTTHQGRALMVMRKRGGPVELIVDGNGLEARKEIIE